MGAILYLQGLGWVSHECQITPPYVHIRHHTYCGTPNMEPFVSRQFPRSQGKKKFHTGDGLTSEPLGWEFVDDRVVRVLTFTPVLVRDYNFRHYRLLTRDRHTGRYTIPKMYDIEVLSRHSADEKSKGQILTPLFNYWTGSKCRSGTISTPINWGVEFFFNKNSYKTRQKRTLTLGRPR